MAHWAGCNRLNMFIKKNFSHSQWQQASLPVRDGGLGVRTAYSLASSAFLASAVNTLALQNRILPCISDRHDTAFHECLTIWSNATSATPLTEPASHRQRAWDRLVVCGIRDSLLAECVTDIERARFLGLVLHTQVTGCLRRLFHLVVCF